MTLRRFEQAALERSAPLGTQALSPSRMPRIHGVRGFFCGGVIATRGEYVGDNDCLLPALLPGVTVVEGYFLLLTSCLFCGMLRGRSNAANEWVFSPNRRQGWQ